MNELIISLINHMAILVVVAYILTRSRLFTEVIVEKKINLRNSVILILIFSAFSIYGTISSIPFIGALISISDLGPALGVLIAGPIVGFVVGLIGAFHRYFYAEGITQVPCSIAALAAGVAGGLVFMIRKGKLISIYGAFLFGFFIEIIHILLTVLFLLNRESDFELLPFLKEVSLPVTLTSAIGMSLFIYIIKNLMTEKENEQKKKNMESELKVASEIQKDMVPNRSAILSQTQLIDISGYLHPAKQVGGDLYDFFMLDEDHLCFLIGDVSDKGVPAALFMARSQSFVRSYTNFLWKNEASKFSPSRVLQFVNIELYRENDNCMFITLSYWVMNLKTGHLVYSVGGHNPPILKRNDGNTDYLNSVTGPPLGINPAAHFRDGEVMMKEGDLLFLYTDGITEANNRSGDVYSEERLLQALKDSSAKNAENLIDDIMRSVNDFTQGAEQSDDITCLAVKYLKSN